MVENFVKMHGPRYFIHSTLCKGTNLGNKASKIGGSGGDSLLNHWQNGSILSFSYRFADKLACSAPYTFALPALTNLAVSAKSTTFWIDYCQL